jgi:hypothetical protein
LDKILTFIRGYEIYRENLEDMVSAEQTLRVLKDRLRRIWGQLAMMV